MICPECQKNGETSRVQDCGSTQTLAYVPIQYDERGNPILGRNPNITRTRYACSRGHSWEVTSGGL